MSTAVVIWLGVWVPAFRGNNLPPSSGYAMKIACPCETPAPRHKAHSVAALNIAALCANPPPAYTNYPFQGHTTTAN